MKRRMLGVVVAAVALTVVPSAAAVAQSGATCTDVTITQSPPGWHVSETYECDGCRPLTVRPTSGGAVYTINSGCPR